MLMHNKHDIRANHQNIRKLLKLTAKHWELNIRSQNNIQALSNSEQPQLSADPIAFEDQFTILKKIGEGANAIVYSCILTTNNQIYAAKRVRADEQQLLMCKRIYSIMIYLNHPDIVKVKALFLDKVTSNCYLVILTTYQSLHHLEKNSNLLLKKIVRKVLGAILYMHSKGVCHRDIKPDNILYHSNQHSIKIIDFGISKLITPQKPTMTTSIGTIHYMAPQMLSYSEYNQLVDIWALGILTYQLFYNQYPFDSQYQNDLKTIIINKQPQYSINDHLLNDFIKGLLKKNPEHRISAKEAINHPWILNSFDSRRKRLQSDCFENYENTQRGLSEGKQTYLQNQMTKEQFIELMKEKKVYVKTQKKV